MAAAGTLTIAEVRLIKAMLRLTPRPSNQSILSYFTRPGRDINHRVIAEIASGDRWRSIPAANEEEALAYMAAVEHRRAIAPEDFVDSGPASGAGNSRHLGRIHLDWWPAGQGLFATGTITRRRNQPLTWVYDCGTASSQSCLQSSLNAFEIRQRAFGCRSIRLAVLSHFDKDHISGLVKLIRKFPIRTLLLPYIPAWRRLVIAIEGGVGTTDPEFGFFLDPTGFLAGVADGRIEEIVFVPSSGPEDFRPSAAEPRGPEPGGEGPADFGEDLLKVEEGDPPPDAQGDPSVSPNALIRVRFLRPGGKLLVPFFWEFLPYNDAALAPKVTPAFVAAAEHLRGVLLTQPLLRKAALANMKALYEQTFTTTAERNLISLFLYSGPLSRRIGLRNCPLCLPKEPDYASRFSQMHTGDGYLNDDARYDAFARFYGPEDRLTHSAFLQVMHHGSRTNWRQGVAAQLNPKWSIFSSDPAHKRYSHPHAEVLRDFWPHGPVQVDKTRGFHVHGWLEIR